MAVTTPVQAEPVIREHARPARYSSNNEWLKHGFDRQDKAIFGALVAAWTGLAVALWIAVGGIFVGALAGALGANAVGVGGIASELGLSNTVGVLAGLLGAVIGFVLGLLLIYIYLFTHPVQLVGALAGGALIGLLIMWVLVRAEPLLMKLRGYREPSRREQLRLEPLLLDVGQQMGLSVVPAIWISDQQKPGAWAHMRGIVLTQGLMGDYDASESPPRSELDETALAAILAHELHHWDTGDVVGLAWITAFFWPMVLILNAITWIRERGEWLGVLLWCIFWPVWFCSKFVVGALMAHASRRAEFEADACAASLGDPYRLGLRRALDELSAWEAPRTGWEDVIAATHPPIEHRLERLEAGWVPEQKPKAVREPELLHAAPAPATNARSTPTPRARSPKPATRRQKAPLPAVSESAPPAPSRPNLRTRHPADTVQPAHDGSPVDDRQVKAAVRRILSSNADLTQAELESAPYELNLAVFEKLTAMRESMQDALAAGEPVPGGLTLDDLDRCIEEYDIVTGTQAEEFLESKT